MDGVRTVRFARIEDIAVIIVPTGIIIMPLWLHLQRAKGTLSFNVTWLLDEVPVTRRRNVKSAS